MIVKIGLTPRPSSRSPSLSNQQAVTIAKSLSRNARIQKNAWRDAADDIFVNVIFQNREFANGKTIQKNHNNYHITCACVCPLNNIIIKNTQRPRVVPHDYEISQRQTIVGIVEWSMCVCVCSRKCKCHGMNERKRYVPCPCLVSSSFLMTVKCASNYYCHTSHFCHSLHTKVLSLVSPLSLSSFLFTIHTTERWYSESSAYIRGCSVHLSAL